MGGGLAAGVLPVAGGQGEPGRVRGPRGPARAGEALVQRVRRARPGWGEVLPVCAGERREAVRGGDQGGQEPGRGARPLAPQDQRDARGLPDRRPAERDDGDHGVHRRAAVRRLERGRLARDARERQRDGRRRRPRPLDRPDALPARRARARQEVRRARHDRRPDRRRRAHPRELGLQTRRRDRRRRRPAPDLGPGPGVPRHRLHPLHRRLPRRVPRRRRRARDRRAHHRRARPRPHLRLGRHLRVHHHKILRRDRPPLLRPPRGLQGPRRRVLQALDRARGPHRRHHHYPRLRRAPGLQRRRPRRPGPPARRRRPPRTRHRRRPHHRQEKDTPRLPQHRH
mmetsp:Transcript_23211/g.72721  ORF Transcript_23211/g.72721 Transcript_23211/m.72721 type:complete len:341 (-) Transcript_23211:60-1082(-)